MAGMGYSRHLDTDSPRPPAPAVDVLRVYGMKFCPYVHRLKLVLAAKGIKHEAVNINLSKKPQWYFDLNPHWKVPTMEKNGVVIYDSEITTNYVDEVFPGKRLRTTDPLQRAKELMIFSHFGNAISGYYGYLRALDDEEKKAEMAKKMRENLARLAAFLHAGGPYVCGETVGLTDYLVWPHLERIAVVKPALVSKVPALKAYFERMGKEEAVVACRHPDELHKQFFNIFKGDVNVYDIGIVE